MKQALILISIILISLAFTQTAPAFPYHIEGVYYCKSIKRWQEYGNKSKQLIQPCNSKQTLIIAEAGWVYGMYHGQYEAVNEKGGMPSQTFFWGGGGAATWGPATVGMDTLTFYSNDPKDDYSVVWAKEPDVLTDSLLPSGPYYCNCSSCPKAHYPIILHGSNHTYTYGNHKGTYSVVDDGRGGKTIQFSDKFYSSWGPQWKRVGIKEGGGFTINKNCAGWTFER